MDDFTIFPRLITDFVGAKMSPLQVSVFQNTNLSDAQLASAESLAEQYLHSNGRPEVLLIEQTCRDDCSIIDVCTVFIDYEGHEVTRIHDGVPVLDYTEKFPYSLERMSGEDRVLQEHLTEVMRERLDGMTIKEKWSIIGSTIKVIKSFSRPEIPFGEDDHMTSDVKSVVAQSFHREIEAHKAFHEKAQRIQTLSDHWDSVQGLEAVLHRIRRG